MTTDNRQFDSNSIPEASEIPIAQVFDDGDSNMHQELHEKNSQSTDPIADHDDVDSSSENDQADADSDLVAPADSANSRSLKKSIRMRCNRCCRDEYHLFLPATKPEFPLTVVMSLGLVYIVGPFACVCCGNRRLFKSGQTNPGNSRIVSKRIANRADAGDSWERDRRIHKFKQKVGRFFRKITKPIRNLLFKNDFRF